MNAPGPMLEILTGDLSGRRYRVMVDDAQFVIGRAPTCDLVLPKRYISREHARITRDGPEYVIDGLSHSNPVLLGDRPARPRAPLNDGDEFELCKIRFRFVASGSGERVPTTKKRPSPAKQHRFDDDDDAAAADERDRSETNVDRKAARTSDAGWAVTEKGSGSSPAGLRFDDAPAERTAALPTLKSGVKSESKRSGSGVGGAEVENERTAELGKVRDPNDPDYDPFAEVDTRKKKKESRDPGRDKALKALMVVGALGIVLAGFIIRELNVEKPIEYVDVTPVIRVALNETVRFEEPWSQVDPPAGRTTTRLDAEPYVFHRDNVVEVEWGAPGMETKCVFLVRGLELGETQFELHHPVSRRIKRFTVIVEGDDPHEVAREARRAALRGKTPAALRKLAIDHLGSGDSYTKEREVASREGNYRLALIEYSSAVDAAVTLRDLLAREGTVPNDVTELVRRAEEAEHEAQQDHDDLISKTLAVYRTELQRNDGQVIEALKRCLRAIHRDCDPRAQRLCLILDEGGVWRWTAEATEHCADH